MAMKRPRPSRSSASSDAWPPAPKVASTTVSPGSTARSSLTSSARTATWSAALCGKAFGNTVGTPFHFLEVLAPDGAVPDLDVVANTGDHDLACELRVLHERRGQRDAALLVRVGLRRAGEHEARHLASLLREGVEPLEPKADEALPLVLREHVQTAVHAPRHDSAGGERLPEARGKREAVLVIEGVL